MRMPLGQMAELLLWDDAFPEYQRQSVGRDHHRQSPACRRPRRVLRGLDRLSTEVDWTVEKLKLERRLRARRGREDQYRSTDPCRGNQRQPARRPPAIGRSSRAWEGERASGDGDVPCVLPSLANSSWEKQSRFSCSRLRKVPLLFRRALEISSC